jgi:2-polyprenyl-3-methyl-5-hydroxy-6-metoxy-1,4-benzoquinol methylase
MNEQEKRPCWCGNSGTEAFSPEYQVCRGCGTLVSQVGLTAQQVRVCEDETDYYGRAYWQEHQTKDLLLPPIEERASLDLAGRCVYWLRKLLRYQLPPASILELGSAHGALVALLRAAGFDAAGLEVSPWVVDLARRTFHVPVLCGPVEEQHLENGSLDAIILNDLLEHLPQPVNTIGRCTQLLRSDGLLVIQTPRYPAGMSHEELQAQGSPFLEMMAPKVAREHLYLFSEPAIRQLLERFGFQTIAFEPPAFRYDMYLFASRRPLRQHAQAEIRTALEATVPGRLVAAWLDVAGRVDERQAEVEHLHSVLDQKWIELSRAAQIIAEAQSDIAEAQSDLQAARAERERYWLRLADRHDLGPTAIKISRALTRLARGLPLLAKAFQRLTGLGKGAA